MSQDVISLLQNHRSIRKFKEQALTKDQIRQIIHSAQMAATSNHIQAYSMIGITDKGLQEKLSELAGSQESVRTCPHFIVFCADLYRVEQLIYAKKGQDVSHNLDYTEMFMVATIDAALAAQNAAVAAEALGLGICYIGGIRNNPEQVAELLGLPEKVYPVFGMAIGYPDQDPGVKPRLPFEAVYFENSYQGYDSVKDDLDSYDEEISKYYSERTAGKRTDSWSDAMAIFLEKPKRTFMRDFLTKQGFPLK